MRVCGRGHSQRAPGRPRPRACTGFERALGALTASVLACAVGAVAAEGAAQRNRKRRWQGQRFPNGRRSAQRGQRDDQRGSDVLLVVDQGAHNHSVCGGPAA